VGASICVALVIGLYLNRRRFKRITFESSGNGNAIDYDFTSMPDDKLIDFGRVYLGAEGVVTQANQKEVIESSSMKMFKSFFSSNTPAVIGIEHDQQTLRSTFINPIARNTFIKASAPIRANRSQASDIVTYGKRGKDLMGLDNYSTTPLQLSARAYSPRESVQTKNTSSPVSHTSRKTNTSLCSLSVEQVHKLVTASGFSAHASKFSDNFISGSVLAEITTADELVECGITLPGPVQRALMKSIEEWRRQGILATVLHE
jgi:hypothetical protein